MPQLNYTYEIIKNLTASLCDATAVFSISKSL